MTADQLSPDEVQSFWELREWTGWYCRRCQCQVDKHQVTYDERHSDPEDKCLGECIVHPPLDSNAIEAALDTFSEKEWERYDDALWRIVEPEKPSFKWKRIAMLRATLPQRARAIIAVLRERTTKQTKENP